MKDITELLNQINLIPEDSLLERIISYCEENELNPQELGDSLAESEQFKRVLWINAVENNQIQDVLLKNKLKETLDLDEW
jgi:hypothetical protein